MEFAPGEERDVEIEIPASVSKTGQAYIETVHLVNRDPARMSIRVSITDAGVLRVEVFPTPKPPNGESRAARARAAQTVLA